MARSNLRHIALKSIATAIAVAAAPTLASAADIQTRPCGGDQPSSCQQIGIFGEIKPDDGDKFVKLVADKGITKAAVYLSSPGGNMMAAFAIGREIKRLGFSTFVEDGSVCASACSDIWLAGKIRFYEPKAKIGFHAPYKVEGKGKKAAPVASTGASAMTGAYYAQLGLSAKAIYYLVSAPPSQMFWLSADAAQKLELDIVNYVEFAAKNKAEKLAREAAEKVAREQAEKDRPAKIKMQERIVPVLSDGGCPEDSAIEPFERTYCVRNKS